MEFSDFKAKEVPPAIKNIALGEPLELKELVNYAAGQVVSRTLAHNKRLNLSLFAFFRGEGLSTHSSGGDALVQVLDGIGQFTIAEHTHTLPAGNSIVLPANVPHAVHAPENFKMLLTVVKPG
jgi:quercetin dioxygenase-like cupin family protein